MSIHEDITVAMHQFIDARRDAAIISPTAVASAVLGNFKADEKVEVHIEYASLEHLKHIARRILAGRFEDEGEDNPVYGGEQGELFSGHLQERYPVPRRQGIEPQYKLRSLLTAAERAWNVRILRKSADARMAHADALEAEARSARTA